LDKLIGELEREGFQHASVEKISMMRSYLVMSIAAATSHRPKHDEGYSPNFQQFFGTILPLLRQDDVFATSLEYVSTHTILFCFFV
jgi:hypothetical protein